MLSKRELNFYLATSDDLATVADLRWRLQTDDEGDEAGREAFTREFPQNDLHTEDLYHFLAEVDGKPVGAISVRKVWKVPAPGRPEAAWGYFTNTYVLPEHRNDGVGAALLAHVEAWAHAEELELLIVWPSDRAYPFYERAGYTRRQDPLVLMLEEED